MHEKQLYRRRDVISGIQEDYRRLALYLQTHTVSYVAKVRNLKIYAILSVLGVAVLIGVVASKSVQNELTDISARIMKCSDIQGEAIEINEAAVVCAMDTMRASLKAGTYTQIYDIVPLMQKTNLRIACHQAAHRLGVELLESISSDEIVEQMFEAKPQPVDDICTHSLVHGLIQGMTTEQDAYDLQEVADQCLYFEKINPYYTDECAHYYGHAVWKKVNKFNDELGDYCKYLYTTGDKRHVIACMGGVIMQKYDLQIYTPMSTVGERILTPPTYEEIDTICDAYRNSEKLIQDGCMSGIGWLAPTTALSRLDGLNLDEQVVEYKKALATCKANEECERTFLFHFRVDAYGSGVVTRVCNETKMTLTTCDQVVAKFSGNS